MWDVDDVFPALETDADAAQCRSGDLWLRALDTSVPLDAWEVNEEEGVNFLWAESSRIASGGRPGELGVDVLACVTRHWLRDNSGYICRWWPRRWEPAGDSFFGGRARALKPEGPETDRAIANALVSGLARVLWANGHAQQRREGLSDVFQ